jgi:ribonuclease J
LSKIGIKALIIDALYAPKEIKTPSEKIARNLLEGVLFTTDNRKSGMVITTFSSHIARLKSIVEFGRKLGRKVILLGRSLNKYATAAERIGQLPFKGKAKIFSYKRQVASILKKVNKNRADYLVVCTGHQGEPGSILDRLSRNDLPFRFKGDNHVIFASRTIPSHITEENRMFLEKRLKRANVRIFDNVHVSGHAGREDLRDLIRLTNPENVIPAHGDLKKLLAGVELAKEMGYKLNKDVHLMKDGKSLTLN